MLNMKEALKEKDEKSSELQEANRPPGLYKTT